ncbi:hypothetical protein [Tepidimonas charontis]|uniref:Tetratricopeptide repeat protein n=1 Tax=Tepidimonas charontis TaxID=2267262 RepID=A0A554XCI3_9BURK|nr:hypothetical protein [Tepidimonas charontis]TSE33474.1 hypothetical protein Tchar_01730 [Tepidimonas charontis]
MTAANSPLDGALGAMAHIMRASAAALALCCGAVAAQSAGSDTAAAEQAWQQAQQALHDGDTLRAQLWLERTLMLDPDRIEALVQLALIIQRSGDSAQAQPLIDSALRDPRLTPALRQALQSSLSGGPAAAGGAALFAYGLQYSDNPLLLSPAREVEITLPSGPVLLPNASQPKPAWLHSVEWAYQSPRGVVWDAAVQASTLSDARTAWRLGLTAPLSAGQYVTARAQQALDGGRHAALLWGATLGETGAAPGRRASPQAVVGLFDEPSSRRSGATLRLVWTVQQEDGRASYARGWPADAALWLDAELARRRVAHASRRADQARAGIRARWRLGERASLNAQGYAQADLQGYSPLLGNGAPRRVAAVDVDARWTLWRDPRQRNSLELSLSWTRRWSNLALYRGQERSLMLRWQHQWER